MTDKTSGDSSRGVSSFIFRRIQDSFTTQVLPAETAQKRRLCRPSWGIFSGQTLPIPPFPTHGGGLCPKAGQPSIAREPPVAGLQPWFGRRVMEGVSARRDPMPYALFSNDAKLSKAYPTEADVWKHARKSGLVVDVMSEAAKPAARPVLDNDYEIRPCRPDPEEDPARIQADAEREEQQEFQLSP